MRPPASPPNVRRALIDTSGHYALADPRDANHLAAVAIAGQLRAPPIRVFTTNFILAETHALLLARCGRPAALQVLQRLDQSATIVVRVSARDERRARDILRQYDDKDFPLTDATSFAVMERLAITHAFTFDRNFSQYGLSTLLPDRS